MPVIIIVAKEQKGESRLQLLHKISGRLQRPTGWRQCASVIVEDENEECPKGVQGVLKT